VKIKSLFWQESKIRFKPERRIFISTLPKEVLRNMITDGNLKTAGDLHSYLSKVQKLGYNIKPINHLL